MSLHISNRMLTGYLYDKLPQDDIDTVLLGLRVYTKKHAPVKIAAQLRRGQLMTWKLKD